MAPQQKLPESILTVWRLETDGRKYAAYIGERAFWRWPRENLRALKKGYGLFGLILILPIVFFTLVTAPTTIITAEGEVKTLYSGLHLAVAAGFALVYIGIPLLLGLRRQAVWQAGPGMLTIDGRRIAVDGQTQFRLVETRGRQHFFIQVELATGAKPGGIFLTSFHTSDRAPVSAAVKMLATVSGATYAEIPLKPH